MQTNIKALRKALGLAEKIEKLEGELSTILNPQNIEAFPAPKLVKKRTLSAEGRQKIAAAQRKRWRAHKRAQAA